MKRLLVAVWCWLHDHRASEALIQVPGRAVYMRSCRCGRVAAISGRRVKYPLRRVA